MASKNPKLTLRHLLLSRSDWVEAKILDAAKRNGYKNVSIAMNRMFAHLGGRPIGLSELARRLSVSRQAVHKLAQEAERQGVVEFIADETDARVKLLRFSQKGWAMADIAMRDFAEIEAQVEEEIGKQNMAVLLKLLTMPWSKAEAHSRAAATQPVRRIRKQA